MGKIMPSLNALAFVGVLMCSAPAAAHMIISSHETRDGAEQLKDGPCGADGSVRGDVIHTFEAGSTIELRWDEFIPHPGHYRLAFDEDGQDDFVDPAGYEDFYTNDAVLVDDLFPHQRNEIDGTWVYELQLPDTPCTNCTLQLVQMMTDKPPYVVGTNDLYYNCLDLVLTAPAVAEDVGSEDVGSEDVGSEDVGSEDVGSEDVGSEVADARVADQGTPLVSQPGTGCMSSASPAGGGWLFVVALAPLLRRRA